MNPRKNIPQGRGPQQKPHENLSRAHKPGIVQRKAAASQTRQPQTAPPVYRPQPVPRVLQPKMAESKQTLRGQSGQQPLAPAVYKPQRTPAVLQAKKAGVRDAALQHSVSKTVSAVPAYKPNSVPHVLHTNNSVRPSSSAAYTPRAGAATVQRKGKAAESPRAAAIVGKGIVQRAKYVPPSKRGGASSSAAAYVPLLKNPQALVLYNWLSEAPRLTFDKIVDQKSDYVTLQLNEEMPQGGGNRKVLFNVHNYFGRNPYLGGTWAVGVYKCAMNAQENPRAATLLSLWTNFVAQGPNPSLDYDAEDDQWDVFFDASEG